MKLDLNDYATLPSKVGEQIHCNHHECPSGTDTKKRLYIKKVSATGYVWFCHHCSGNGISYVSLSDAKYDSVRKEEDNTEIVNSAQNLTGIYASTLDHVQDINVVSYLRQYHLTDDDIDLFGIQQFPKQGYIDEWHDAVYAAIPDYNSVGSQEFKGQLRTIVAETGHITTPRYYSYGDNQVNIYGRADPKVVYITEDSISAGRIFFESDPGKEVAAISLKGSSAGDVKIDPIVEYVKGSCNKDILRIIIWLDDDEAGRKASIKLHKQLKAVLGSNVVVVATGYFTEPKLYDKKRLGDILKANNG